MLDKEELNIHAEEAKSCWNLELAAKNVQRLTVIIILDETFLLKLKGHGSFDLNYFRCDYLKPLWKEYVRGPYEERMKYEADPAILIGSCGTTGLPRIHYNVMHRITDNQHKLLRIFCLNIPN